MVEVILALMALIMTGFSIFLSYILHKQSKEISKNALRLSKQQKQLTLLSILAPACADPDAWAMLIKYLNKNNALPYFEEDDYETLSRLFERMSMKIKISKGKMELD